MNKRLTYTMKWPSQKKPGGLAICCHMRDGLLAFHDTIRGHGIEGKVIKDGEDAFSFLSTGFEPGIWEFKALTIEDFRRETFKIVVNGAHLAQTFQSTDELQKWYWEHFGFEDD